MVRATRTKSYKVSKPEPARRSVRKKAEDPGESSEPVSTTEVKPPTPKNPPKFAPNPNDGNKRYWLIKSEPESRIEKGNDVKFSLKDLKEVATEPWTGVRNYEARNNMLNMRLGDRCLFYHSNCKIPGIVGIAEVSSPQCIPDPLQFDSKSPYFDAKSDPTNPKWWCVMVKYVNRLRRKIPLKELQADDSGALKDLALIKRGRLSVIPLSSEEYFYILKLQNHGNVSDDIDCDIPYEVHEED